MLLVALAAQYRVNTVFFSYINLLENYLNVNQYDIAFIVNEISNRRNGRDIDKESQLFSKVLCIEGYGKINAPYITPPLGTGNHESNFDAFLFAKSAGDISAIEKQTYVDIIKAIYFDYFLVWYSAILLPSDLSEYNTLLQMSFDKLSTQLSSFTSIPIAHSECPILNANRQNINTTGLPPAAKQKKGWVGFLLLVLVLLICPVAVVWIYNHVLTLLSLPTSVVGEVIGNYIGAIITAIITLFITKKRF